MLRYVLRRLVWMVPTVLVVTFMAFWAVRGGTDPVQSYLRLNPRASPAAGRRLSGGERSRRLDARAVRPLARPLRHR